MTMESKLHLLLFFADIIDGLVTPINATIGRLLRGIDYDIIMQPLTVSVEGSILSIICIVHCIDLTLTIQVTAR